MTHPSSFNADKRYLDLSSLPTRKSPIPNSLATECWVARRPFCYLLSAICYSAASFWRVALAHSDKENGSSDKRKRARPNEALNKAALVPSHQSTPGMDMDTALRDPALVSTYSNPFPFSSGRAATMLGNPFRVRLSPFPPLQVALRPCSVNLSPFTSHLSPFCPCPQHKTSV